MVTQSVTYKPTTTEEKVLEVMLRPDVFDMTQEEIGDLAGCSRRTVIRAMKKKGFRNLVRKQRMAVVDSQIDKVLLASLKRAQEPEGYQDRRMLLQMRGYYKNKQQVDIKAETEQKLPSDMDDLVKAAIESMDKEKRQEVLAEVLPETIDSEVVN